MPNKLLFITALCLALNACQSTRSDHAQQNEYDDDDYDGIELIVVSKTPRGAIAGEEMAEGFEHVSWYEIGLSRNGEEPIEYIWVVTREDIFSLDILHAKIGDKGTVYLRLTDWVKERNEKLPQPNAEDPPIIGFKRVLWEKRE